LCFCADKSSVTVAFTIQFLILLDTGMSRGRTSKVYDFFHEEESTFNCSIECGHGMEECGQVITKLSDGGTTSNLKRHLKRIHPTEYEEVQKADVEAAAAKVKKQDSNKGQTSLGTFYSPVAKVVTSTISTAEFKQGLLKMICYDALPFTFFEGKGFQQLNGKTANSLGISLGRNAIRDMVMLKYREEKTKMIQVIKDSTVSLKFDCVTRLRSHFLGITIQYYQKGVGLCVRTLTLRDTKADHTSLNIKNIIVETLKRFEIPLSHVLACVVDNASNMTKTVQLLCDELQDTESSVHLGEPDIATTSHDVSETDLDSGPDSEPEMDAAISLTLSESESDVVYHMRCAEHTLQLAVRDSLKKGRPEKLLTKVRKIAHHLRTPTVNSILKRRAGKGMLIDMPTRWGSTYLMLKRLQELKAVILDMASPEAHLIEQEWRDLDQMIIALNIPHLATIKLQKEHLTPGECMLAWKRVSFDLDKLNSNFAKELSANVVSRQKYLLSNEAFLAAVWVSVLVSLAM